MKKSLSILMVMVMVLGMLAGCAPKETAPETAPEATEAGETTTEAPAEEAEETSGEPTELVISTWGYNEDKLRKNVFEPFENANNVKIILETGNNSDRLNKIRTIENTTVDLIFLAGSFAIEGIEEGLFDKVNAANVPNLDMIYDMAKAPHGEGFGPAYTLNRTGIIYDTAMVDAQVTSWNDLWRAEFESNVSIPEITTTAGPAMVVLSGTVSESDALTNADMAFAKLTELKPNLVKTYGRSSELVNMFTQGEIVIGVAQDFAFGRIKEAVPTAEWVNPVEGAFANLNTINIVKGSKNKEVAEKFIDWMLSEEVQNANALDKIDSPVNVNVVLTDEEAQGLTYGTELIDSLVVIDEMKVNASKAEWIDRWNREVSN